MGKAIVKLAEDTYVEWSTISDAPTTYCMTREKMLAYLHEEYGRSGQAEERMARADEFGSSWLPTMSAADAIAGNRAGDDEEELTLEQIIVEYTEPKEQAE